MNTQNNINDEWLTITTDDISTSTGEGFKALDDDLYDAACAGIIVKEMQNYDKDGVEDKMIFCFQIPIDDGKFRYIQSKPMKKSLHIKSGLWKLLADWTKQKDPATLISKMGTGGKFDISYFIGKPVKLMIKSKVVGVEPNEKIYNNIDSYMAPKKGQTTLQADNTMPGFMVKDAKSVTLDPSVTVFVKTEAAPMDPAQSAEIKKNATEYLAKQSAPEVDDEGDDSLPFN